MHESIAVFIGFTTMLYSIWMISAVVVWTLWSILAIMSGHMITDVNVFDLVFGAAILKSIVIIGLLLIGIYERLFAYGVIFRGLIYPLTLVFQASAVLIEFRLNGVVRNITGYRSQTRDLWNDYIYKFDQVYQLAAVILIVSIIVRLVRFRDVNILYWRVYYSDGWHIKPLNI